MSKSSFAGFPADLIPFLEDLADHNERDWFQAHRDRYEASLLIPALEFITAVQVPLGKAAPMLQAVPKKVGGSLMRIYRDTRFAKDKSPYKTNVGIHFRHEAGCDVHAPGFYVHIEPGQVFFGAGIWHPSSDALRAIRTSIVDDPGAWKKARDAKTFRERFELAGDSLKRPPQGFPADHPYLDDLKRKDFIALQPLKDEVIQSPKFVDEVIRSCKAARPLMQFLCNALDVPY